MSCAHDRCHYQQEGRGGTVVCHSDTLGADSDQGWESSLGPLGLGWGGWGGGERRGGVEKERRGGEESLSGPAPVSPRQSAGVRGVMGRY